MADASPESRSKRQLFVVAAGVTAVMVIVAIWVGVHRVPWLGPRLHDIGVSIFGRTAMGWVERVAYAADDGWNKLWGIDERPEAYWNLPASSASASASGAAEPSPPWVPHSPGPMVHTPFTRDDGLWFPIVDSRDGTGALVFRLVLHPDGDRADAPVKVAAVDLRRTQLRPAPGKSVDKKAGLIPVDQRSKLVAILLPGRRAPRGGLGLVANGVVLRRSKPGACVIGQAGDQPLRVGFRAESKTAPGPADWWMQMPPCVLENGELQPGTGDTAPIQGRRLLLGLSRDGQVLLAGIAESVGDATASRAMRHAGAWSAATVDSADGRANVVSFEGAAGKPLCEESEPLGENVLTAPWDADRLYVVRSGP